MSTTAAPSSSSSTPTTASHSSSSSSSPNAFSTLTFPSPLSTGPSMEQVRREVWKGSITARISLDPDLLPAGARAPEPELVELPRQSYPHVHWEKCLSRLRSHLPPRVADDPLTVAWCEAGSNGSTTHSKNRKGGGGGGGGGGPGLPVRWNVPAGVSFDMLGSPHALPWRLVARFGRNPPPEVLPLGCGTAPADHAAAAAKASKKTNKERDGEKGKKGGEEEEEEEEEQGKAREKEAGNGDASKGGDCDRDDGTAGGSGSGPNGSSSKAAKGKKNSNSDDDVNDDDDDDDNDDGKGLARGSSGRARIVAEEEKGVVSPAIMATRDAFMHALKESQYARQGSSRAVLALPVAEAEQLWDGVAGPEYDLYWQVNRALRPPTIAGVDAASTTNSTSSTTGRCPIPTRICVPGEPLIQLPLSCASRAGATVRDALAEALPHLYEEQGSPCWAPPAAIIQGIEVDPADTPLQWAYDTLAHPDNFLYITLMRNDDPDRPTY